MAIRPVLKMGHPILRQVALPITQFGPELHALIADMDSPRGGIIRVQPQNLTRLLASLAR